MKFNKVFLIVLIILNLILTVFSGNYGGREMRKIGRIPIEKDFDDYYPMPEIKSEKDVPKPNPVVSSNPIHSATTTNSDLSPSPTLASDSECCLCDNPVYLNAGPKTIKGFNYFQKKSVYYECYKYYDIEETDATTSLTVDSDYSNLIKTLTLSAEGGAEVKGQGIKAKLQMDFIEDNKSYYYYIHYKTSRVIEYNYLIGTGKIEDLVNEQYISKIKDPNYFIQYCGNYLKKKEEIGISIVVQIQISFTDKSMKSKFDAKAEIDFSKFSELNAKASAQLELENKIKKIDTGAKLNIKAKQYGGEPHELLKYIDACNVVNVNEANTNDIFQKIKLYVDTVVPEQTKRIKDNAIVLSTVYIDSQVQIHINSSDKDDKITLDNISRLADASSLIVEKLNYYHKNIEKIMTVHKDYYTNLTYVFKDIIEGYYTWILTKLDLVKKLENELCLGNIEKCNKMNHSEAVSKLNVTDERLADIDKFMLNIKNFYVYEFDLNNWYNMKTLTVMIKYLGAFILEEKPFNTYQISLLKSDYTPDKNGDWYYFRQISIVNPYEFSFEFYYQFNVFPRYADNKDNREVCINWEGNKSKSYCGIPGYPAYLPKLERNPAYFYPFGTTLRDRKKRKTETKEDMSLMPKISADKNPHQIYLETNPNKENLIKGYNTIQNKQVIASCFKYVKSELKEPKIEISSYNTLEDLKGNLISKEAEDSHSKDLESNFSKDFVEDLGSKYFYFKLSYFRTKEYTYEDKSFNNKIAQKYVELYKNESEIHNDFVELCGNATPKMEKLGLLIYIQIKFDLKGISSETMVKVGAKLKELGDLKDLGGEIKGIFKSENLDTKYSIKIVKKGNSSPIVIDNFECSKSLTSRSLSDFLNRDLADEIKKPSSLDILSTEYTTNDFLKLNIKFANSKDNLDEITKMIKLRDQLKSKNEYYLKRLSEVLKSNLNIHYHPSYLLNLKKNLDKYYLAVRNYNDKSNEDKLCKGSLIKCSVEGITDYLSKNDIVFENVFKHTVKLIYNISGFIKFSFSLTPISYDTETKETAFYAEEIVSKRSVDYLFKSHVIKTTNDSYIPIVVGNTKYVVKTLQKSYTQNRQVCFELIDKEGCQFYFEEKTTNPFYIIPWEKYITTTEVKKKRLDRKSNSKGISSLLQNRLNTKRK